MLDGGERNCTEEIDQLLMDSERGGMQITTYS